VRIRALAVAATSVAALVASAVPAVAADDPETSDDCSLIWVTNDELEPGYYFGDARLQCPVKATVGARWTLDGREIRRYSEQLGPGEVPVFDDIQPAAQPGQRLCFIAMAQVGRPRTRSRTCTDPNHPEPR
jgi:hypothetical protein